ncbi:MAG TPA: hypothetical protein VN446_00120 [Candidatus Acidoferrum sp.]|nr:hypothetical protein [Candidatus Acidoferrum sp.]
MYIVAYFIAGITAQTYYTYFDLWEHDTFAAIMRPLDSPLIALAPALQAVNAFFTATLLYPLRSLILDRKKGWRTLFLLIAGFSIFVPQAPAPGSFEGLIYTKTTLFETLIGLPETFIFSFLFSFGLCEWYKNPKKRWNVVFAILVALILLMSILGYLAAVGIIQVP